MQSDNVKLKIIKSVAKRHQNFSFFIFHFSFREGISLMEAVVYVALLGAVSVFVANSLIQIVHTYARARAEREALANARTILERVTTEIAASQEIYGPTSKFDTDLGQLSLVTSAISTAGHAAGYVDFWLDNGAVSMRREGAGTATLSAASVRVGAFRFERIIQALGREAVRTTIRVDAASSRFPASAILHTTTALRGNY